MTRILLLLALALGSRYPIFAQPIEVVGYLPYYRFGLTEKIDFSALTHLNLAFLNPDSLGQWSLAGTDPAPVIAAARQAQPDLVIYISIAGGALTAEWAAAYQHWMQPPQRSTFIHRLMAYVEAYGLDGVDVDLEWSHVDEAYSPFVLELRDSLSARGWGMTAALPAIYRYPEISEAALAAYERIHIMAYDKTGPWNPQQAGQHSSFAFAQQAIAYWLGQGVPAHKLTLGVPFYGYDFGSQPVSSFTFGSKVAQDTAYAWLDQVGQAYYNGIPTIRAKTELARQSVAGIMIWELGQDALEPWAEWSLLAQISATLRTPLTGLAGAPGLLAYPNPLDQWLTLARDTAPALPLAWQLWDSQGRQLDQGQLPAGQEAQRIPVQQLASGLYLLTWQEGPRRGSHRLLRP